MAIRMIEISYLNCIIICHGKSEKVLFEVIKQDLRLKMFIDSDKKGKKSIQINSLLRFLKGKEYRSREEFLREFKDIKLIDKDTIDPNFKIFIIMDTDDVEHPDNLKKYLNKEMFRGHHLYDFIVPIYNTPDLESVFEESGHKFKNKGDDRKKEYKDLLRLYPTPELVRNYLKGLEDRFRKCKNTNMDEVFRFIRKIDKPQI